MGYAKQSASSDEPETPPSRGIACLEGDWDDRLSDRLSVEPLLRLLVDAQHATNYMHRDVATRGDFRHHLDRWLSRPASEFPVLYLAFHGSRGTLHLGGDDLTLQELQSELHGELAGRTLYFGSCRTVDAPVSELQAFCAATRARAVAGYTKDVGWLDSAALDLIVLARLIWSQRMDHAFKDLQKVHPVLVESLGLRIVTATWSSPGTK